MKGRDGDIITLPAVRIMQAIHEARGLDGWTPLYTLRGEGLRWGSLSNKFIEVNGAYVRLTHDAQVIFNFSKQLEQRCPPVTK